MMLAFSIEIEQTSNSPSLLWDPYRPQVTIPGSAMIYYRRYTEQLDRFSLDNSFFITFPNGRSDGV